MLAAAEQPAGADSAQTQPDANGHDSDGLGPDYPLSQVQYKPALSSAWLKHGHSKAVKDVIHGLMDLGPLTVALMDTPHLQRLKRLKQLGITSSVWPCATHNRFEHSLGTAHLAATHASHLHLVMGSSNDDKVRASDVALVEAAGLCHDLGHGPFSHCFEKFLKVIGKTDWTHEFMSVALLDHLYTSECSEEVQKWLPEHQLKKLFDMITASEEPKNAKGWLYDIVANGRNSLDVDKFDYLPRDSYYTGCSLSTDFNRVIKISKVIDDEICFRWKEYQNVFQVYGDRAKMHQLIYHHSVTGGAEYMIIDCLAAADRTLKFSEDILDPEQYLMLDDSIESVIRTWGRWHKGHPSETDPNITEAQKLLRRLDQRNLYKCCNSVLIPSENLAWYQKPTVKAVLDCNRTGTSVHEDDVIVDEYSVHMTAGNQNPLDKVSFYDFAFSETKRRVSKDQVSNLLPVNFQEKHLRLYCKLEQHDPRWGDTVDALHSALETWTRQNFGNNFVSATPRPKKTLNNSQRGASQGETSGSEPANKRAKRALAKDF
ncbi:hypothetical protein WJX73_006473 [Symbiochloris irregularis]|uniref:HD domain-containing protein n=1 Tax=Symbiochloris irregularis TaxID=706552 RepID=A0AAW1NZE0_9CHLO